MIVLYLIAAVAGGALLAVAFAALRLHRYGAAAVAVAVALSGAAAVVAVAPERRRIPSNPQGVPIVSPAPDMAVPAPRGELLAPLDEEHAARAWESTWGGGEG